MLQIYEHKRIQERTIDEKTESCGKKTYRTHLKRENLFYGGCNESLYCMHSKKIIYIFEALNGIHIFCSWWEGATRNRFISLSISNCRSFRYACLRFWILLGNIYYAVHITYNIQSSNHIVPNPLTPGNKWFPSEFYWEKIFLWKFCPYSSIYSQSFHFFALFAELMILKICLSHIKFRIFLYELSFASFCMNGDYLF